MGVHKVVWYFFAVAAISCATGEIYFQKGAPQVKLSNNAVLSGSVDYSREGRPFHSFMGVPFGTIPARFEEAVLAPAWDGVRNATEPGNMCTQPLPDPNSGNVTHAGEEDCLNLNVCVPVNNTQREGGLPVMVWIHGGGFSVGGGAGYGAQYFMDEEVILVTINYRLGVFGFLSTGDSIIPGNNGLKDQVLALRWVKEHIGNFEGDPNRVTIFGQSAGGASVHYLMLSPTTEGLFQQAIAQSGSALAPWAYNPNPRGTAMDLATHLGCANSSSQEIARWLTDLPAEELNFGQFNFIPRWPSIEIPTDFGPVTESNSTPSPFLTESPWRILAGETEIPLKAIPWMTGATEDEGAPLYAGYSLQDQEHMEELETNWEQLILRTLQLKRILNGSDEEHTVAERIRQFYFGLEPISAGNRDNLTNVYSDVWFAHSVRKGAMETASRGGERNPVYLYKYAHLPPIPAFSLVGWPIPEEEAKKVGHCDDYILQFSPEIPGMDSRHVGFSKELVKLWASFAIHGKPNHTWGSIRNEWLPISRDELNGKTPLRWYTINENPDYSEEGPLKERSAFWEQLFIDYNYMQEDSVQD